MNSTKGTGVDAPGVGHTSPSIFPSSCSYSGEVHVGWNHHGIPSSTYTTYPSTSLCLLFSKDKRNLVLWNCILELQLLAPVNQQWSRPGNSGSAYAQQTFLLSPGSEFLFPIESALASHCVGVSFFLVFFFLTTVFYCFFHMGYILVSSEDHKDIPTQITWTIV